MKTLILYYSHSGKTQALARKRAEELGAEIEEIVEVKRPSVAIGILRAIRRKKTPIAPLAADLGEFDKIIIMSPVWAGHPVSAINAAIALLPQGKQVEFVMNSAGGGTKKSAAGTKSLAVARGCEVVGYEDVKVTLNGGEIVVDILS
ncbi:MAG: hypothetical protein LBE35_09750 [Clostridiales bacterium]|nr:hypothetical protein [Clostridiales bacterium]